MHILHISDLHGCANFITDNDMDNYLEKTKESLETFNIEKLIVLVSGDLANQGNAETYKNVTKFLNKMKTNFKYDINFVICPGNHDIVKVPKKECFSEFDNFVYSLSKKKYSFKKESVTSEKIENINFILLNSCYLGDHKYGFIDIKSLHQKLKSIDIEEEIILILHHHLIPVLRNDISTVRNAFELLVLLENYNIKMILHGHQHMNYSIKIGSKAIDVLGVGSFTTALSENINNQFNFYNIDTVGISKYCGRFIADKMEKGKQGAFEITKI